ALRVLFRFSTGLPYRLASDEEKQQAGVLLEQVFQGWRDTGVRLIGTFGNHSAMDGFAHYVILEIDDLDQVHAMDRDIVKGVVGKYVEKFSSHIGWARPFIDSTWNSAP